MAEKKENIITFFWFTGTPHPSFKDNFFEFIQMIVAWNKHTKDLFIPSRVYCLDESIPTWTNNIICLGWMFVSSNPHSKVKE